jgi:hypothetical protein
VGCSAPAQMREYGFSTGLPISTAMSFHPDSTGALRLRLIAAVALGLLAAVLAGGYTVSRKLQSDSNPRAPSLIRRGPHVSAALQPVAFARLPKKARPARSEVVSCDRPGGTNHVANCKGLGRPAVEPWIVTHAPFVYAAAGDYNSWDGQAGLGFYLSRDGRTWFDGGPLDLFPHDDTRTASGDPQLAVDSAGVVYYSSVRFNFARCTIGGVELGRRDPMTARWRVTQIAANSKTALQDRPALAVDVHSVYFAWTQFDSCEGEDGPSLLEVALLPTGSAPVKPTNVLQVPGSRFSQGAAIAADGDSGFWLAWEEFPDASASNGWIELAHWSRVERPPDDQSARLP